MSNPRSCQPLIKNSAVKELRDLLMCPVCLVVPTTKPIYQCDNGHVVCKDCFPRYSTSFQLGYFGFVHVSFFKALLITKVIQK